MQKRFNLTLIMVISLLLLVSNLPLMSHEAEARKSSASAKSYSSKSRVKSRSNHSFNFKNSSRTKKVKAKYGSLGTIKSSPNKKYSSTSKKEVPSNQITSTTSTTKSGRYASSQTSPSSTKKPSTSAASKTAFGSSLSKSFANPQSQTAFKQYKTSQQVKFKQANPVKVTHQTLTNAPVFRQASHSAYKTKTYFKRRKHFYKRYSTPDYLYGGAPSYGILDGMFLGYMLSQATQPDFSDFYYHHYNDAGMVAWRADMEEQANNNPELRQQLAQLEQQAEKRQQAGLAKNPNYIPQDMDADLILSPETMANMSPTLRLCTAKSTGNYYWAGQKMRAISQGVVIELLKTAGSTENLQKMADGSCDAAFVQRDSYWVYADAHPNGTFNFEKSLSLYNEYVHLICNRDAGIDSVKDLGSNDTLLVGEQNEGSAITWVNFVAEDSRYSKIKTIQIGGNRALSKVVNNQAQCMLYVSGLNADMMKGVNRQGKRVKLAHMNDWDFNDSKDPGGNIIYSFQKIPSDLYPNLQDGFISSTIKTITVPVDIVVSKSWGEKYPDAYDAFLGSALQAQETIQERVAPN